MIQFLKCFFGYHSTLRTSWTGQSSFIHVLCKNCGQTWRLDYSGKNL